MLTRRLASWRSPRVLTATGMTDEARRQLEEYSPEGVNASSCGSTAG